MNADVDHARAQIRIPGLLALIAEMPTGDIAKQLAEPGQTGKPQSLALVVTDCGCQANDR